MRASILALVILGGLAAVQAADVDTAEENATELEPPAKSIPPHLDHGEVYTEAHASGDLPQLPIDRSPVDSSWSNSVAVCAVTTVDYTTDVREWIQYHRWRGVEHIYLVDNAEEPNTALPDQLRDYLKAGFVTIRQDAANQTRTAVYRSCIVEHRHKYNWMAFIDTDEFLVVRKPNSTLAEFLNNFKFLPGLAVHEINMGSSGRSKRPARGGVLRLYRQCDPRPTSTFKIIANTYFLANISPHPHNMEFRGDARAVNERMTSVSWRETSTLPHECQSFIAPTSLRLQCRPIPGASVSQTSIDYIAIYHYVTQSSEDFPRKVHHFTPAGETEEEAWAFFKDFQRTASFTDGVCAEASMLADICCSVPPFKYTLRP